MARDTSATADSAGRTDSLLDGRIRIRQPTRGYRVAIDPVLMAGACPAATGARVLDLGCGVGAAGLCLMARVPQVRVVGLELQPALAAMAAGNAMLNDWHGRFMAVAGDVRRPPFRSNGIFDHVMCNPPYHKPGHGHEPANPLARAANVETAGDLMDFAAAACRLVRRKGTVTLVHRADRLADVVAALADRAGDIVVIPVRPKADADAHRVVVRARAGVAGPLRLAADLTLHTADGAFTREATAILRKGSKLHR